MTRRNLFRRLLVGLLCLMLVPLAAAAEDCFLVDVDSLDLNRLSDDAYVQQALAAQTQGVRVTKYISDSNELVAHVRLTLARADDGTVLFDKNYGYRSGVFDSGPIYLPFTNEGTVGYIVTLCVEDWTYAIPFFSLQPKLEFNSGCTYGARMHDYSFSLTDNWVMGTMLDLDALRPQGSMTIPLCASNRYLVGQATVSLMNDSLTVGLAFVQSANVEVLGYAVYCIGSVSSVTSVDPLSMSQPSYGVGEAIGVSGLSSALLYVPMTLSYDPTGLSEFVYDLSDAELQAQLSLWDQNFSASAGVALWTDDGFENANGWEDGAYDGSYDDPYNNFYDGSDGWSDGSDAGNGDSFDGAPTAAPDDSFDPFPDIEQP